MNTTVPLKCTVDFRRLLLWHVVMPRERFYRGIHVARFYGPRYPGFGFFYDDAAAFAFLGLTAWELSNYNELQEEQLRAHEAAMAEATSSPPRANRLE